MKALVKMATMPGPIQEAAEEAVRRHSNQFGVVDLREGFEDSPHVGTQSLYLRAPPWPLKDRAEAQNSLVVVNWPLLQIEPLFQHVLQALEKVAGIPMARALVVKLLPGHQVKPHTDEGRYAELTERFHYVVKTNSLAAMGVGDEDAAPKVGEVWWVDKSLKHWAFNNGQDDRIHVIFDGWRQ